jgi:hypothetical protein
MQRQKILKRKTKKSGKGAKDKTKITGRLYGLPFSFVFFGLLFVGRGFSFRGVVGRFWALFWGFG